MRASTLPHPLAANFKQVLPSQFWTKATFMLISSLFEKLQIANWLLHSGTYLPIAALLLRCELFIFSSWLTPHVTHLTASLLHRANGCRQGSTGVWKADILKLPILSSYEDCTVGWFIDKLVFPIRPHKQHGCDKIKNEWNLPIKSTWGLRGRVHLLEGAHSSIMWTLIIIWWGVGTIKKCGMKYITVSIVTLACNCNQLKLLHVYLVYSTWGH